MKGVNSDVSLITVLKGVIVLVIAWGWALAPPISGSSHPEVDQEAKEAEEDTGCWPSGAPLCNKKLTLRWPVMHSRKNTQ